ncbi:23S rRNA (pseudouridine(1915)-N(3))-methyltransferase RlmH [Thioalkalivibrio sp. XN279]|uniref:23S rRNA (pseudouridine(1915)-N(3))-methyltransferase RlmH n=1 Tax=Thioalkalivibrio sp. XN279 TaxID=2714953 RepID=UPI00140AA182|nr:23S rRNA (pseudouridine(1915)-N(3))-methyltransferase RlmH [Thioalkalivibrio sp. XN279]
MRLRLVAVGTRMPSWVEQGFAEYAGRMPRECRLELRELPLGKRSKQSDPAQAVADEGRRLLAAADGCTRVCLDVRGRAVDTAALAQRLAAWLQSGRDVALLVGGPDGLAPECLAGADWRWSLTPLTLPHGLVRVMVAEQLYRAWTVLSGHPYHRA